MGLIDTAYKSLSRLFEPKKPTQLGTHNFFKLVGKVAESEWVLQYSSDR
jgi:hypothetical protein